jgi:hypothetical protein
MARVKSFQKIVKDRVPRHTDVDCGYAVVSHGGAPALLLETYGSSQRAIPGKTSQSLLLERDAALQLSQLIRRAFP